MARSKPDVSVSRPVAVVLFVVHMESFTNNFCFLDFHRIHLHLTAVSSHWNFSTWEIRVAFSGESQLRQSRATQTMVHAGCFIVSLIHRSLTWTTGSLTCAQILMHAIAHGVVRTHVRESALKVNSGRKIPCRTG